MATTYTSFVTALANITVTGVKRKYALNQTPPVALNTASLPAQFIWPGGGVDDVQRVFQAGGWPQYRATLVVVVEPVAQSNAPANYAACVGMIDNVRAALEAEQDTIAGPDVGALSWSIREDVRDIAGTSYWLVLATVSTGAD